MLWVLKRTASTRWFFWAPKTYVRRFFEHPKHMLKMMGKKIFTVLRWTFLLMRLNKMIICAVFLRILLLLTYFQAFMANVCFLIMILMYFGSLYCKRYGPRSDDQDSYCLLSWLKLSGMHLSICSRCNKWTFLWRKHIELSVNSLEADTGFLERGFICITVLRFALLILSHFS